MIARIYKPAKNAMQSGQQRGERWCLEYEPQAPYGREPLMGWTTMRDTMRQVKLFFPTREAAISYAQRHGIDHVVLPAHEPKPKRKSYSDNFRTGRKVNWTH